MAQPQPQRSPAPAPTPITGKDGKPETSTTASDSTPPPPQSATDLVASFAAVPGAPPVPTKEQCKAAVAEFLRTEAAIAKLNGEQAAAIKVLVAAGYDEKPATLTRTPYRAATFYIRKGRGLDAGTTYGFDPYVIQQPDDLSS